jgi:hypothetical protein
MPTSSVLWPRNGAPVTLWVCRTLPGWLPLVFSSRCPRAALFNAVGFPSGLQVPVPFKALGMCLRSTPRGDQSGPVLALSCLSLWGPLGLALGFNRTRVRCLDVDLFNGKLELGTIKVDKNARSPRIPCFVQVFSSVIGRLQACSTLCGMRRWRSTPSPGFKSCSSLFEGVWR